MSNVQLIEIKRTDTYITYDLLFAGIPIAHISKPRDYVQESYE